MMVSIIAAILGFLLALGFTVSAVLNFEDDEFGKGAISVGGAVFAFAMSVLFIFWTGQFSGLGRVVEDLHPTELSIGEVYEVLGTVDISGEKPVHVLRRVSDGKILAYRLRVTFPPRVFIRYSEQQAKEKIQEGIKKIFNGKLPSCMKDDDYVYDDYLYGPVGSR